MTDLVYDPVSGTMKPPSNTISQYDNDGLLTDTDGGAGVGAPATGGATITQPSVKPEDDDNDIASTITEDVIEEEIPVAPDDEWFERPEDVPIPEYDPNAIQPVNIPEAPAYVQSQEQQDWAKMHSEQIQNIIDKQGIGIDEATQQLMKQQTWDLIKADRNERLRRLKQNMETRGITNAGLYLSESMKIHANATKALAASVTEVKIKSAFMKMASYENALGLSQNFLSYLSEQSQLEYAPKLAAWSKRADAKIAAQAASVQVYVTKLQQAYAINNMNAAASIEAQFTTQQNIWAMEAAELEQENAIELAKYSAAGSVSGSLVGAIPMLIK